MGQWTKISVSAFMTAAPQTIGFDQTLETAHKMMRAGNFRHLPVLKQGELVGLISLGDLHLIETLSDVNPAELTVDEAMSQPVYVIHARASLQSVCTAMAKHKYGCAVVTEKGKVVGLFTANDALAALSALLDPPRSRSSQRNLIKTKELQ